MDGLTFLSIDLKAAKIASERQDLVKEIPLGKQMLDSDYHSAIKEYYCDIDIFEDWMVEPLFEKFKEYREFETNMSNFTNSFLSSFIDS